MKVLPEDLHVALTHLFTSNVYPQLNMGSDLFNPLRVFSINTALGLAKEAIHAAASSDGYIHFFPSKELALESLQKSGGVILIPIRLPGVLKALDFSLKFNENDINVLYARLQNKLLADDLLIKMPQEVGESTPEENSAAK